MTEAQIQNAREFYWQTQSDDMQGAGVFTWDQEEYPCFVDFVQYSDQLSDGGVVEIRFATIRVPNYSVDPTTLALVDIYPAGAPGEGDSVIFRSKGMEIVRIDRYIPGEGFALEIQSPDQPA